MSTQPADAGSEDPVAEAFAAIRAEAQRRTGRIPDLSAHNPRPGLKLNDAPATPRRPKTPGKPTGPDGRRLRRSYDVEPVGSVLSKEIQRRGWRHGIAGGWVHSHWDELVGEKIAAHTKVEILKEKSLFISCNSTAWATNLRMMQRTILQAIAEKVGPDVVAELKIFGPKTPSWRHGPLHVKGRGPRDTYG
ncbi:DciA family protein [Corynebacterium silvaticum]|uniref:DciA family protein n=1 Tax=Corynebacterium silvaticum TaxID=2320431 RepID=A0A7U5HJX0_9CORY|nr:DciA family protein [Corynebacterium silvaticum]ARU45163.1 DciA family protein [Corynebacterium silvaticum]MBH5300994.1 DUF721 domain-containing protein [Corynebacterium silvaticum]NOM65193.1 DUF721 domain-containing protein [Corynebacterium silvaticum]TFA92794.1 DUF721 domain-containing protein [Corynebacterium silvaticum]TFA96478.1 DUF721 domain-containing protein [Corynebacterium silvaticum]